jgi:hypothetical protein
LKSTPLEQKNYRSYTPDSNKPFSPICNRFGPFGYLCIGILFLFPSIILETMA